MKLALKHTRNLEAKISFSRSLEAKTSAAATTIAPSLAGPLPSNINSSVPDEENPSQVKVDHDQHVAGTPN
jgi:hypothetical protein